MEEVHHSTSAALDRHRRPHVPNELLLEDIRRREEQVREAFSHTAG
jgi:hypothetical protein